jgi:hypothetical protein
MFTAKVRKNIYALSGVVTPLLTAYGVATEQQAALWSAAAIAVANLVMAFLNVPGDDES